MPSASLEDKAESLQSVWDEDSASDDDVVALLLSLQKLARTSPEKFATYWTRACRMAKEITDADLPPRIHSVAAGVLALDALLRFDLDTATKLAPSAITKANDLARYVGIVSDHLAQSGLELDESRLDTLPELIEQSLVTESVEEVVMAHQCYIIVLHYGLMYNSRSLIVKAEQYVA